MKRSLRSWLWGVPLEQEVDEEFELHVELAVRELVEQGMDPRRARTEVLRRFGDVQRLKRTCVRIGRKRERQMRLTQWVEELRHDVTFALRQMKIAPGFSTVAVVTLALGIGANSAMFALADATLIDPLPVDEPDRLVMVWEQRDGGERVLANPADAADWIERNRSFEAMAAYMAGGTVVTGRDGLPESVATQVVTPRFFDVLGVVPRAGRLFIDEDARTGDAVVLSEAFWQRRFGGDPAVVGRAITLDGAPVVVVGVAPSDVRLDATAAGGERPELWRPLGLPRDRGPAERSAHYQRVVGRLRPDVSLETAQAEMTAVAASLAEEMPETNRGHGVVLEPLREWVIGSELRLTALLLAGVTGFILLTCCANVANLLLARTTTRMRELAVRSALGAGRRRIARQLLTEGLVLSACGGLLGAATGWAILRAAPAVVPSGLLPPTVTLGFDARVLAFCAASALLVAVAFGLTPLWQATGASVGEMLSLGGRTVTRGGTRLRNVLVVVEVSAAVLLLCGGGLLLRTLIALEDVDSGARAGDLLTMNVNAPMSMTPDERGRFYEEIQREVAQLPEVGDLAWGSTLPFDGRWYTQAFQIAGDPPRPPAERDGAAYQIVGPAYFDLLGIPILEGRGFTDRDTADAVPVCLVNEAFVRRYLGNRPPIGQHLSVNAMSIPPTEVRREIVGVVAQVKERPEEVDGQPHIYVPLAQNSWWLASLIVAPADGPAAALAPAVRAAVARVDPNRSVTQVRTLASLGREATARPRFRAIMVGAFAALALLLAVVGVSGVLAYSVRQRAREFGIRVALGASAGQVLRVAYASAARVIVTGAAIGLLAAMASGQLIAAFLFAVDPLDAVTFVAVPVLLALTAGVATLLPALRAARTDPTVALRGE